MVPLIFGSISATFHCPRFSNQRFLFLPRQPLPFVCQVDSRKKKQNNSVKFCSPSLDYSVSLKVWSTLEYTYLTRGALFLKLCFAKCSDWAIEQVLINILLIHCVHIRINRLDTANNNNMIQGAPQTERSLPWFLLIKYWAPFLYVPFF